VLACLIFLGIQGYNVIPLLFLGGLLYFLFLTVGSQGLRRRQHTVLQASQVPTVSFEDVGGQENSKKELVEALDFVRDRDSLLALGIRPLKGILLVGPPGTGKTMLAKAAASYTDSVFIATSGSEFIEVYAGVGAQRVRDVFRQAREEARKRGKKSAIIFIDELEVLGGKRGKHSSHLEYDQTLNQLLVEMDGLTVSEHEVLVLVVGATNRADLLDEALLRPGRFDRVVRVELPDKTARYQIITLHVRNKPLAEDVDLHEIARQTFGFSGAHLESVANEAAILARRAGKGEIGQTEFIEAIEKVMLGERIDRQPSQSELRRVAFHEGGHALVGEVLKPGYVSSINISPRGATLGYVRNTPAEDVYLYTKEMLEDEICVALGGAVAEELMFGNRSTGAGNDFQNALGLAKRIVYGGLSPLGVIDEETVPAQQVHDMITAVLRREEERAHRLLCQFRGVLEIVANRLLHDEMLTGEELRSMLLEPQPLPSSDWQVRQGPA